MPINSAQILSLGYQHDDDLAISLTFDQQHRRQARLIGFKREDGTVPDFCYLHVEGHPLESRVLKEPFREAVESARQRAR